MGDLDVSSYQPLVSALPLLLVAFAAFAWLARPLNLLSLGADSAETRGLEVASAQRRAFFSASLATGAAVSVGGPIGFIGIIVPHLVRLMVGSDHRVVLPASALFGAAFLVGCDVLARTLLAPVETAGRRDHGADRRTVLPVAAGEETMIPVRGRRRAGANGTAVIAALAAAIAVVFVLAGRPAARASQPSGHPARIISVIPAVTEMLFAIGAGPQVVAVGSFDDYPPEVARLPRVGALLDPDVERILSLRPDLVIVYESQNDLRTQLARVGIGMFVYKHAGLADITTTISALGDRVGRQKRGGRDAGRDRSQAERDPGTRAGTAAAADGARLRPRRRRAPRHLRERRRRLPSRHARRRRAATTSSPTCRGSPSRPRPS